MVCMKIKYSVCFNSVCSSRSFVSNVFWISSELCGVIITGLSWQQNFTKISAGGCGSYNRVSIIPTQLWSGSDQDACLTGWKFEIRAYHLWSSNNHGANFILTRGHLNVASQNTLVFTYWSLNLQPVSLPLHVSVIGFHRILFFLCLLSCRHFIKKCCKEILKMMHRATYAEVPTRITRRNGELTSTFVFISALWTTTGNYKRCVFVLSVC